MRRNAPFMRRDVPFMKRDAPQTSAWTRGRKRGRGDSAPIAVAGSENRAGTLPRGASALGPGRFTPESEADGDS